MIFVLSFACQLELALGGIRDNLYHVVEMKILPCGRDGHYFTAWSRRTLFYRVVKMDIILPRGRDGHSFTAWSRQSGSRV